MAVQWLYVRSRTQSFPWVDRKCLYAAAVDLLTENVAQTELESPSEKVADWEELDESCFVDKAFAEADESMYL